MSKVFFASELEGVATFWRIFRMDGVALAFTSHDRNLWFGGIMHSAAPGMVPSSIRRTADLSADSAEVQGALTHASISSADLGAGRFDNARIVMGLVDWESLEHAILYGGTVGRVTEEGAAFTAELASAKAVLDIDPIPRTSPGCRAAFCGPGCTLSSAGFTRLGEVQSSSEAGGPVDFGFANHADYRFGHVRWLDGPLAGLTSQVLAADVTGLTLDHSSADPIPVGTRAELREGCDHTLATCSGRFGNAINFQGEPFLPGNDLLARYPGAK